MTSKLGILDGQSHLSVFANERIDFSQSPSISQAACSSGMPPPAMAPAKFDNHTPVHGGWNFSGVPSQGAGGGDSGVGTGTGCAVPSQPLFGHMNPMELGTAAGSMEPIVQLVAQGASLDGRGDLGDRPSKRGRTGGTGSKGIE